MRQRIEFPAALACNPLKPRLQLKDAGTLAALEQDLARFDRIVVSAAGRQVETRGLQYASIDRAVAAERLSRLARTVGCEFVQTPPPMNAGDLQGADLIVVADGEESRMRASNAAFRTTIAESTNAFVAFELATSADALSYVFQVTPHGVVHAYAYPRGRHGSVMIVEAPTVALRAHGIDKAPAEQIAAFCRGLFPAELAGAAPAAADMSWRAFATVAESRLA